MGALVAVGAVIFFASRTVETAAVRTARPSTRIDPAATSTAGTAALREATSEATSVLTKLAGKWRAVDTHRDFDAVVVGDAVEFRISDGQQFGSVDRSGDVRFVLRPRPDSPGAYAVTDQRRDGVPGDEASHSSSARLFASSRIRKRSW